MNQICLTILASAGLYSFIVGQGIADETSFAESLTPQSAVDPSQSHENMAKNCEGRLEKIKDSGASLPADKKTEFDYHLEIAGIETKALKDPNHKDLKRHVRSCHRHLKEAEHIVQQHERHVTHEKEREERKLKREERKAKAEERRVKAAARKAERDAARAKKTAGKAEKAAGHHHKNHEKDSLDHGRLEGENPDAPGKDAQEPLE